MLAMVANAELPLVLVIDDEMGPRESLRMLLKPCYQVHTADSVEKGLKLLSENKPDAIVMDIRMPGVTGIEGLRRIRQIDPHLSVIMLTGFGALETAKEALRLGANDYISKPFDAREMREVISRNVERTRLHRTSENAAGEIKELNNRLLQELAQKERLASLGQASAEFVHDIGNPLTIVWGYVQLLAKKLEESERTDDPNAVSSNKELEIIEQNVRLCRDLLTMWQSYGSVEAAPHKVISVSEIVCEVVASVGAMAKETGVELKVDVTEDRCSLPGDAVQITRAIQNVIINAIQASADSKGTVEVNCIRKDFYVDVRIADTGHGISPEQVAKIFDPYFTTKPEGRGTGLGLASVYGMALQNDGLVSVRDVPGGTRFTLWFPRLEALTEPVVPSAPAQEVAPVLEELDADVLVVEDVEQVRDIAARIL
ncbi:MAG TPA: hybrid sensor histidine kinase/response regulator, partial [Chthoniobacterales bacterium]|nr:hybrid sensor histidine kinase/response regulator [Chthoniobacterales bacterium]